MSSVIVPILSALSIVGGFGLAALAVYMMDCLSKPGERRRQLELAANRATKAALRIQVVERVFPEKFYSGEVAPEKAKEDDAAKSEEANGEVDPELGDSEIEPCAICIEPFNTNDSVITGLKCRSHICHRHCMMEWLKQHNDCPVCREPMWNKANFIEAKKEVLTENPQALAKEMAQMAEEKRMGFVLLNTNQEPDDIVIEELNEPNNDIEMVNTMPEDGEEEGENNTEEGDEPVVEEEVDDAVDAEAEEKADGDVEEEGVDVTPEEATPDEATPDEATPDEATPEEATTPAVGDM